jgi:hypothetical protein
MIGTLHTVDKLDNNGVAYSFFNPYSVQPAGSPLDVLIPQESRTLRSNQLCFKIMVRNGLILNHDFKEDRVILHVFLLFMDETPSPSS